MMVFTSAPFNPYNTSTVDKAKTNGMVIICWIVVLEFYILFKSKELVQNLFLGDENPIVLE